MAGEAELGTVTGTYRTDNGRRGRIAVEERSGKVRTTGNPLMLPNVLVGLGVGALLMGIWIGVWFYTRRGEVFELHENGMRYSVADRSHAFTWADVDRVVVRPGKDHALGQWAGGDVDCTIRLVGGKKIPITGLTEDAAQLVRHVQAATAR
jgi:hypothetical protein